MSTETRVLPTLTPRTGSPLPWLLLRPAPHTRGLGSQSGELVTFPALSSQCVHMARCTDLNSTGVNV